MKRNIFFDLDFLASHQKPTMHRVNISADVNYWKQSYYVLPSSSEVFTLNELNEKYFKEEPSKKGARPNTIFECPYCDCNNKFIWCIRDEKRGDRQGAMRHIVNLSHRYNEYTHKLKQIGIDMSIKRTKKEMFELYEGYINVDECRCEACSEQFDTDGELLAHIRKKTHLCRVIESTQTNHIDFETRSINVYPKLTNEQIEEIDSYETIVKLRFDNDSDEKIKCTKHWVCNSCVSHYAKADIKKLTFKNYGDICRHIITNSHKVGKKNNST